MAATYGDWGPTYGDWGPLYGTPLTETTTDFIPADSGSTFAAPVPRRSKRVWDDDDVLLLI